jgi:hypothetical protein
MKMKKEVFSRGVRMQHQFGDTINVNDPLQMHSFNVPLPENRLAGHSPGCEVQEYGEKNYRDAPSPVQKPNGSMASIDGPVLDLAEAHARPDPVGTKRRLGPPKTDK